MMKDGIRQECKEHNFEDRAHIELKNLKPKMYYYDGDVYVLLIVAEFGVDESKMRGEKR